MNNIPLDIKSTIERDIMLYGESNWIKEEDNTIKRIDPNEVISVRENK